MLHGWNNTYYRDDTASSESTRACYLWNFLPINSGDAIKKTACRVVSYSSEKRGNFNEENQTVTKRTKD